MNDALRDALTDRYRLEHELGAGGMATVYLAEDVRHRRKVAIKVLHPELSAVLGGERFLKEIELTASLQHPHILPLFDSGEAAGQLWYAMPYVEGETLRGRLTRETQLPIADALLIAREVADALAYAHARGVIHRDIKPENILLQGGHALVADFGIALAVQTAGGARMTQTGLSLGTPQYMAPEQAMGERAIDARADVYALGAVTYEMLAGEPPFTGPTAQAIVARVMSERPRPLGTVRDRVPAGVAAIVGAALEKLPADRPATAAAFAAGLVAGEPAAPAASRAADRARPTFALVAGLLVVGAALGAGGMFLARRTPGDVLRLPYAMGNAQLTFDGRAGLPALSPGGETVAFVRSQCEQPGESGFPVLGEEGATASPCRFTLVAMDSVGTRQVTVVDGLRQVVGVRFTNDGTQLVVAGETESGGSGIFVVPRLGGALRRVAPGRVFDVRRGADTLLVVGTPGPTGALFARVVDLATGRVTDSLALPSPNVSGVALSPDGRRVATISSGRVYVVDRSGQLTDSIESVFRSHVRWTPRGDAIVGFIPAPGLDDAFVRLGIDGRGKIQGQPVALLPRQQTLYRGEFDVAWRSGAVAYVGGIMMNTVMTFGLDNRGTPRVAAAATTYYDTPVLSPDGTTLYLTRGDALGDNVYRVRLDAPPSAEEPLTTARGSAMFASLQVTADGQRVYFAQKDTGAPHARWIDPASGDQGTDPIPAALDPMHVAMPVGANGLAQLGANGHRIQFTPRRGTPFRELQLPDSIQVLSITGDADGRELGAIARVGSRVEVATIGLDPLRYVARTVLDGPATSMRLSWHGDGDLYVARWIAGHGRPTLMRIPRTGGRALPAGDVPPSCRLSGTTVALRAPLGACLTADGRGDVRLIRVPGVEP